MHQITKEESQWLIKNNYIKTIKGKHLDLIITSKKKKAKRKKYYTTENIARKLRYMEQSE